YTGDGKGKTTAAVGLSVRAAGSGMRVLFVQFFKSDIDPSGEKDIFRDVLDGIELIRSNCRHPFFTGNATDRDKVAEAITNTFDTVKARIDEGGIDLLVLDEVMGTMKEGFISEDDILEFLDNRPSSLEVVLTGRNAPVGLVKISDYVTEMLMIKHPFTTGIKARKGIEF
ncbi:MAG: cob(I)yrinic acid a,c-diamide adenosyltransferase, partial [Deltaproteobacteria bacterium]|nr:cob(I)yrinic acid a,c-diamide adenosyltransferase [Deltaproteobacteria bacterium]